jgi:hypothetical protein
MDFDEFDEEPKSKYGHKPVLHLVLDDCQSSKLFIPSSTNKLLNATIRHRHLGDGLGLSMWFLVQKYSTSGGLSPCGERQRHITCPFPNEEQ